MKFVMYRDSKGEFRWRLIATNGKTLADSGEGYKNKADCAATIDSIKKLAPNASVEEEA
ncbi:YegP family protein [Paludisphaera soli]|uniref:YegP family protein n=1 Tax=Paludisphaera soli TaxID=2712865 RepID=UPI0013EBCA08|nr:DUF1508 domain-containing protein [Paludisphaera soli]